MSIDLKKLKDEGEESSGDLTEQEALGDLRNCQRDIISFRHKCDRQIDEIEKNYSHTVKPYLERRNALIRNIPKFWSKSILNHPLIATVFEPGETEILNYLSNLEVDEDPKEPDHFKIHFSFKKNPYFENRTLTKEFKEDGSTNSPVRWKKGQQFPKLTKHEPWEDDDLGLEYKGFFRWFFDPTEHYCDPIADIIKTCIWYNPMEFFDEKKAVPSSDQAVAAAAAADVHRSDDAAKSSTTSITDAKRAAARDKEKASRKIKKTSSRLEN